MATVQGHQAAKKAADKIARPSVSRKLHAPPQKKSFKEAVVHGKATPNVPTAKATTSHQSKGSAGGAVQTAAKGLATPGAVIRETSSSEKGRAGATGKKQPEPVPKACATKDSPPKEPRTPVKSSSLSGTTKRRTTSRSNSKGLEKAATINNLGSNNEHPVSAQKKATSALIAQPSKDGAVKTTSARGTTSRKSTKSTSADEDMHAPGEDKEDISDFQSESGSDMQVNSKLKSHDKQKKAANLEEGPSQLQKTLKSRSEKPQNLLAPSASGVKGLQPAEGEGPSQLESTLKRRSEKPQNLQASPANGVEGLQPAQGGNLLRQKPPGTKLRPKLNINELSSGKAKFAIDVLIKEKQNRVMEFPLPPATPKHFKFSAAVKDRLGAEMNLECFSTSLPDVRAMYALLEVGKTVLIEDAKVGPKRSRFQMTTSKLVLNILPNSKVYMAEEEVEYDPFGDTTAIASMEDKKVSHIKAILTVKGTTETVIKKDGTSFQQRFVQMADTTAQLNSRAYRSSCALFDSIPSGSVIIVTDLWRNGAAVFTKDITQVRVVDDDTVLRSFGRGRVKRALFDSAPPVHTTVARLQELVDEGNNADDQVIAAKIFEVDVIVDLKCSKCGGKASVDTRAVVTCDKACSPKVTGMYKARGVVRIEDSEGTITNMTIFPGHLELMLGKSIADYEALKDSAKDGCCEGMKKDYIFKVRAELYNDRFSLALQHFWEATHRRVVRRKVAQPEPDPDDSSDGAMSE